MVIDRFSKLTKTVPLVTTTEYDVAEAYLDPRVLLHGPPSKILFEAGKQFSRDFLTDVCLMLTITNLYTSTFHTQRNGQANEFTVKITYAYIAQSKSGTELFRSKLC